MPSSPYNFHNMYNCLISGARPLPSDLKMDADSLLLLTGICADILFSHYSFSSVSECAEELLAQSSQNPHAPLSCPAEALRHQYILKAALSRWLQHFEEVVRQDVLAFFYFCKLLLCFPDVLKLPQLVGYPPNTNSASTTTGSTNPGLIEVSDEAVNCAWRILDNSDALGDASGPNIAIWLPAVLFYAGLTIWCHLRPQGSSLNSRTGTMRTLKMFKDELSHLPWPCCVEMCCTLDGLMGQSTNENANRGHRAGLRYESGP
jgi:hypothetical protein